MTRLLTLIAVLLVPAVMAAQAPADLKENIDRLGAFDYPVRSSAARVIRRATAADAVAALTDAVRNHRDSFVRYRALVLLTGFNDPGTPAVMRGLLRDMNDRVREVAYRWFEQHPDPQVVPTLMAALATEQAEFVRPALTRALAASAGDAQVQRALTGEAGRGFDFFRSAVIEALGDYRATFAAETIAEITKTDGPLQDDAVLALGRIGGPQATAALNALTSPPADLVPTLHAALCLFEGDCAMHLEALLEMAESKTTKPEVERAAISAIGAVAARGDGGATMTLLALATSGSDAVRRDATLVFAGLALRRPAYLVEWLCAPDAVPADKVRATAIEVLHEGFDSLEEDFAEEQFYATARAAYWKAAEGSSDRTVAAMLIDKLEF